MKAMTSAGVVSDTAEYDAFGIVISRTGSTNTQKGFAGNHGYQEDSESGYKLLGHRYYDPATGRFLTRDPIMDGRNHYVYCDNNPLKAIDADGLKKKLIVMLGDTDGLPLSAKLADIYNMYGDEYDIIVKRVSSAQQVLDLMVEADAVVMMGHGTPFVLAGRGGTLSIAILRSAAAKRKKKGKGKLDFIYLLSCTGCADESNRQAYLTLTNRLFGYIDNCPFFHERGHLGAGAPGSKGRAGQWFYPSDPYSRVRGGGIKSGGSTNYRVP